MNKRNENEHTSKNFGDALLELKESKGLSFNKISIKSGLSAPYLFDIAKKKVLPPKDENIIKIAKAVDVDPEYFKEWRNRRLSENLEALNFNQDDYDVPLSRKEAKYLKKIIEDYFKEK